MSHVESLTYLLVKLNQCLVYYNYSFSNFLRCNMLNLNFFMSKTEPVFIMVKFLYQITSSVRTLVLFT